MKMYPSPQEVSEIPYRCPKCKNSPPEVKSITDLRIHLRENHGSLSQSSYNTKPISVGRISPFRECLSNDAKELEQKLKEAKELEIQRKYLGHSWHPKTLDYQAGDSINFGDNTIMSPSKTSIELLNPPAGMREFGTSTPVKDYVRNYERLDPTEIPQSDFQHGQSRSLPMPPYYNLDLEKTFESSHSRINPHARSNNLLPRRDENIYIKSPIETVSMSPVLESEIRPMVMTSLNSTFDIDRRNRFENTSSSNVHTYVSQPKDPETYPRGKQHSICYSDSKAQRHSIDAHLLTGGKSDKSPLFSEDITNDIGSHRTRSIPRSPEKQIPSERELVMRENREAILQLYRDVNMKDKQLEEAKTNLKKMEKDCEELKKNIQYPVTNQVQSEEVSTLKEEIIKREEIIAEKENEVEGLRDFLRKTADKEAVARKKLEDFINDLLNRTENAEMVAAELNKKLEDKSQRSTSSLQMGRNKSSTEVKRSFSGSTIDFKTLQDLDPKFQLELQKRRKSNASDGSALSPRRLLPIVDSYAIRSGLIANDTKSGRLNYFERGLRQEDLGIDVETISEDQGLESPVEKESFSPTRMQQISEVLIDHRTMLVKQMEELKKESEELKEKFKGSEEMAEKLVEEKYVLQKKLMDLDEDKVMSSNAIIVERGKINDRVISVEKGIDRLESNYCKTMEQNRSLMEESKKLQTQLNRMEAKQVKAFESGSQLSNEAMLSKEIRSFLVEQDFESTGIDKKHLASLQMHEIEKLIDEKLQGHQDIWSLRMQDIINRYMLLEAGSQKIVKEQSDRNNDRTKLDKRFEEKGYMDSMTQTISDTSSTGSKKDQNLTEIDTFKNTELAMVQKLNALRDKMEGVENMIRNRQNVHIQLSTLVPEENYLKKEQKYQMKEVPEITSQPQLYDSGTRKEVTAIIEIPPKENAVYNQALPKTQEKRDIKLFSDLEKMMTAHGSESTNEDPRQVSAREIERQKRKIIWLSVFDFLDHYTLGIIAQVCKEWKQLSRDPALWRNLCFKDTIISSKFFLTISRWCTEIQVLALEGLRGRPCERQEEELQYSKNTRGCLEEGMEALLRASTNTLTTLRIVSCDNVLTDRCLWLAGCYSRTLERVAYVSQTDSAGPETIWGLGAGCRGISTLIIPPMFPNEQASKFNNRCAQMIGRCWPKLRVLSIGGPEIDVKGLASIARNCQRLKVLELDHMYEVREQEAISMCEAGLKKLDSLEFVFTPVTPKALIRFYDCCPRLKVLSVHVGISDYFEDISSPENIQMFNEIVGKFEILSQRPGIKEIMNINTQCG